MLSVRLLAIMVLIILMQDSFGQRPLHLCAKGYGFLLPACSLT